MFTLVLGNIQKCASDRIEGTEERRNNWIRISIHGFLLASQLHYFHWDYSEVPIIC